MLAGAGGGEDQSAVGAADFVGGGDEESEDEAGIEASAAAGEVSSGGDVVQVDGSPHDWLEGRGPEIDVDCGGLMMRRGKCRLPCFGRRRMRRGIFCCCGGLWSSKGIPLAIYHDRHGIFERSTLEGPGTWRSSFWGRSRRRSLGGCCRSWRSNRSRRVRPRRRGEWSGCLGPSRTVW